MAAKGRYKPLRLLMFGVEAEGVWRGELDSICRRT